MRTSPDDPSHPHHDLWMAGKEVEARIFGHNLADPAPRVHGNGFIQVDLASDASRRLHTWGHPAIPSQTVRSGIHDHVYGVASEVLVGRIINLEWATMVPDEQSTPTHDIYYAEPYPGGASSADTRLVLGESGVQTILTSSEVIGEGTGTRFYAVEPEVFHSTVLDGPAATLMTKYAPRHPPRRPRILVPSGRKPDNDFTRDGHNRAVLLGIIESVLPDWTDLLSKRS